MRAPCRFRQPVAQMLMALALTGTMLSSGAAPASAPSALPSISTAAAGTVTVGNASITYIARAGDTLISIAQQYTDRSSNWIALGKLNRIDKDSAIPIGTPILIPADLLGDTPSKATVVAMTGTIAAVAADGSTTRLSLGATVLEGARLDTGSNSFLTLALPDQSRISLPSNTRVRIAKLRSTRYLNSPRTEVLLLRGQVESRVSPLDANRGRYEVRTPLSVAGVRGTHFRVGFVDMPGASRVATETLEGKVAVALATAANSPDGLVLTRAKGNITDTRSVGPAIDLLPAPRLKPDTSGGTPEFPVSRIVVQPLPGARAYHLQIATDPEAQQLLAESRSSTTSLAVASLADGNYYARLSAIDGVGLEGMTAIQAIRLRAGSDTAGAGAASLDPPSIAGSSDKSITLRWAPSAGQPMRLQVARDADFTYLIATRVSSTGDAQLPRPVFGTYYARVQLLDAGGYAGGSSPAQPFIVTDQWVMNDGSPVHVRQRRASADR
ncbi:MAG: FecR domain-containing protein [Herminiimonas sp.]|nr:FecR domain-containing protein [Herminiimonas sp.]